MSIAQGDGQGSIGAELGAIGEHGAQGDDQSEEADAASEQGRGVVENADRTVGILIGFGAARFGDGVGRWVLGDRGGTGSGRVAVHAGDEGSSLGERKRGRQADGVDPEAVPAPGWSESNGVKPTLILIGDGTTVTMSSMETPGQCG
jgi:hypothetical protein